MGYSPIHTHKIRGVGLFRYLFIVLDGQKGII